MRATGTFTVFNFEASEWQPEIHTGLPTSHAHITKAYDGEISGTSIAQFSSAFDQARGVGTYVALESFEGALHGALGSFNFVHSATTDGTSPARQNEFFLIVAASGLGELAGITGGGRMWIDEDGIHHMEFEYELNPS